jgi:hypothetical protein
MKTPFRKNKNEFRECLLSSGAEFFVFHFAIKKVEVWDIQNSNFACCFLMGVKLGFSDVGKLMDFENKELRIFML